MVAKKDTAHGDFSVKPSRAERGDTVTITTKPDEGYQVDEVTATKSSGGSIKVTTRAMASTPSPCPQRSLCSGHLQT